MELKKAIANVWWYLRISRTNFFLPVFHPVVESDFGELRVNAREGARRLPLAKGGSDFFINAHPPEVMIWHSWRFDHFLPFRPL